ncbi:ATP synthase mitochondrial F1 complex assembly factor 1, partial [Eschrichtius robustus]|nr:ATP synthase mitochondrial F1 complex assembly factor 1 [Eschrichtius robustus]
MLGAGVPGPGTCSPGQAGATPYQVRPLVQLFIEEELAFSRREEDLSRSDPTAFESRLEKCSEFRKQPVGHSKQGDFIKCVEQKTDTLGKQRMSRGFTKDKTLSSIFNIEMVKDKTAEEIKQIWQQYFAAKDTVYAVIPKEKFDLIWNRAQSCPT